MHQPFFNEFLGSGDTLIDWSFPPLKIDYYP